MGEGGVMGVQPCALPIPRGAGAAIGPNEVLIFDIELLSVKSEAEGKENKESK